MTHQRHAAAHMTGSMTRHFDTRNWMAGYGPTTYVLRKDVRILAL
jgi:hypothetical protein